MDHPQGILRTGDRATVTFEFISQPEYIKEGMKLLFREGKTKVRSCATLPQAFIEHCSDLRFHTGPRSDHANTVTGRVAIAAFCWMPYSQKDGGRGLFIVVPGG